MVGLGGDVADHDLGGRELGVLDQPVMLAEPAVLPVVLVGDDGVFGLAHVRQMLQVGVVGGGSRDVAIEEDCEFHGSPRG